MGMRSVLVVVALLAAAAESTLAQDEEKAATVTNFEGFGDLTNVISTDKTKANLSCESGDMVVKLQFSESFRGVIYADRDRNSPCKTYGDGSSYYVFQIPLQGCGTKERVTSEYRMFVNDIVVRFHPSLELEGDEVKTILCRYPPPVAPLPPILLPPLPAEVPAMVAAKPRNLSEVELMLIICAVFFLGLLLLGVGLAYYCLKKRNIKIVKRRAVSTTGPPSVITKLSGSTLGPLSIPIGDIRIPRATAHSTSGSEAALLTSASGGEQSDTITSDYPSESPSSLHSDVEEVETRSMHVTTSQEASYENRAYLHEEEYMRQQQQMMMMSMTPPQPPAQEEMRERLTTIHEHEDVMRQEEFQQVHALVTQQREYIPPAPRYAAEPPVYARIRKRQIEQLRDEMRSVSEATEDYTHVAYAPSTTVTGSIIEGSIPDNDHASMSEFSEVAATRKAPPPQPPPQRVQLATEMQESRSISEYAESVSVQYVPPAVTPNYSHTEGRSGRTVSQVAEPPPLMATEVALVPTKAAPTRHLIDDRYLTTFTETRTSEDVTKTTRDILETHMKEVPQPKWDVMIRTYPPNEPTENMDAASEVETWEKYSVVSERPRMIFDTSEETLTTMEVQASEPPVEVNRHPSPNWDVLIRVLQPAPPPSIQADTASDITDVRSVLSEDDREKWRAIITTDSTLRTLLTEAKTVEDFQVIRRDERYERLFEQPKWDVIIRILADPHDTNYDSPDTASMSDTASYTSERPAMRYNARRRSEYDTRSRRSSLPPLYEADSPDGAVHLSHPRPPRSRRTSSHRSEFDVRSLTESEVNFARSDRDSMYSADTETEGVQLRGNGGPHFHRPSLMRSTSEVMQGLETIERDSLDEQESVGPYRGQRPLYHRYSPEQSPTNERRHHRLLERSSTEILVDSHQRRSTTDIHMMEERKDQWID